MRDNFRWKRAVRAGRGNDNEREWHGRQGLLLNSATRETGNGCQREQARSEASEKTPVSSGFNNDRSLTQFPARPLEFLSCQRAGERGRHDTTGHGAAPPSFINRLWFTAPLAADMFPFKMSSRAPARFNCERVRRMIYGCSVMASFPIRLVTNTPLPFSMYARRNANRKRG